MYRRQFEVFLQKDCYLVVIIDSQYIFVRIGCITTDTNFFLINILDLDIMNSDHEYSTSESEDESEFDWGSDTSNDSELDSDEELSQDLQDMNFQPENPLESDDDRDECCHWTLQKPDSEPIANDRHECIKHGQNSTLFEDETSPAALIQMTSLTDLFIDGIIDATNECGIQLDEFEQTFGVIKKDEAGRSLIRAFISIKWHMGLIGNRPTEWIWSEDPYRNQPEIKKVMSRNAFSILKRCFR